MFADRVPVSSMSIWCGLIQRSRNRKKRKKGARSSNENVSSIQGLDKFPRILAAADTDLVAAQPGLSDVRFVADKSTSLSPQVQIFNTQLRASDRKEVPSDKPISDFAVQVQQGAPGGAAGTTTSANLKVLVMSEPSSRSSIVSVGLWRDAGAESIASMTWSAVSTAAWLPAPPSSSSTEPSRQKVQQMPPVSPSRIPADNGTSKSHTLHSSASASTSCSLLNASVPSSRHDPAIANSSKNVGKPSGSTAGSSTAAKVHSHRSRTSMKPTTKLQHSSSTPVFSTIELLAGSERSHSFQYREKKYDVLQDGEAVHGTRLRSVSTVRPRPGSKILIAFFVVLLIIQAGLLAGQVQAIIFTSCFWFLVPRIRRSDAQASGAGLEVQSQDSDMNTIPLSDSSSKVTDYSSREYRKKVIIQGLIQRTAR